MVEFTEAVTATKSVLDPETLTISLLQKKVQELVVSRRGKDTKSQLYQLEALSKLAIPFGPRVQIPILMHVVSAQFALQRTLDDYMDVNTWKSCAGNLDQIIQVLEDGYRFEAETVDASDMVKFKSSKMKVAANASDGAMAAVAAETVFINPHTNERETEEERDERLRIEAEQKLTDEEKKTIKVVGSLSLHLTRLEEEYTKSLQRSSHHSNEYVVRLRDESKLVNLLRRFQEHFDGVQDYESASNLALLRVEHLYYRHDTIAKSVDKATKFYEDFGEASMLHPACLTETESHESPDFASVHPASIQGKPKVTGDEDVDFEKLIAQLCNYIYKHGSAKAKSRAVICQVFHHALHDRYIEGRDLLLMSKLQENIYESEVSTMVLFNRMMVTLGMCAFRLGRINDAHQCLYDVCSGRVRELLAQGVNTSRFSDKTAEQEKAEKRRLIPYHQHINLDLLEACHLISAMLLEVPNMAGTPIDGDGGSRRNRVISRTFRKFNDQYNHQVFTGPPEQTRDFVMQAAKALMKGDWKLCVDLVTGMDVWKLVPGTDHKIAEMLQEKIKLEGLRTYMFTFSAQYESLSLQQLCGMFEMSKNEVHSVVSKMMIHRELHASWDQPTETIVLRKVQPTGLQVLALEFAEKAAGLVEANERLLDAQTGGYGYGKEDQWKGSDDRYRRGRNYRGGDDKRNYRGRNQRGNQRRTGHHHNNNKSGGRSGGRSGNNKGYGGNRNNRGSNNRY